MALVKPITNFSNVVTPKFGNTRSSTKLSTMVRMSSSSSKSKKPTTKKAIKETLLAPRFYTTDFDEMETLFNTEINNNLNQVEFEALLQEFKTDYNQTHFVRSKEFKEAADKLQGPLRQIFVEFLERSCTAEFSGFLLYKELGRRLKVVPPSHSLTHSLFIYLIIGIKFLLVFISNFNPRQAICLIKFLIYVAENQSSGS